VRALNRIKLFAFFTSFYSLGLQTGYDRDTERGRGEARGHHHRFLHPLSHPLVHFLFRFLYYVSSHSFPRTLSLGDSGYLLEVPPPFLQPCGARVQLGSVTWDFA
jgi:hypothetical protein